MDDTHYTFPFFQLDLDELNKEFSVDLVNGLDENKILREFLVNNINEETVQEFECKYYTPEKLNRLTQKWSKNKVLSFFHLNIRSLNANHTKLVALLECLTLKYDVIVLSECWSGVQYYNNLLNNYSLFYELPDNSKTGGVAMYIKTKLNPILKENLNQMARNDKEKDYECLWIEVEKDKIKYLIGGYYRHPNTNLRRFNDSLMEILNKVKNKKRCFVFGDLNICLTKYNHDNETTKYVDNLVSYNFLPYSYLPTRITATSATIIDHIYTNYSFDQNSTAKIGLICNDISDHMGNFLVLLKKDTTKFKQNKRKIRIFSKSNIMKFNRSIMLSQWDSVYNSTNVDDAFSIFTENLNKLINLCFPLVNESKRSQKNFKTWITPALKISINNKCKLYKKWLKSKSSADELSYKNYAKHLKKILRKAEVDHYSQIFDSRYNSSKHIWENVNRMVNIKFNSKNTNRTVPKIKMNNKLVSDKNHIAEGLNNYFCSIGAELAKQLPSATKNFTDYLGPRLMNSFFCSNVTSHELKVVIASLKNSKSCSLDDVSSWLIKICDDSLLDPLTYLCNLSLEKGTFPSCLKTAKVIPIFKKGDKNDVANYRTISLTNPLAKILEKLMHNRLYQYCEKYQYKYQFGFRRSYSTSFAVMDVINLIEDSTLNKKYMMDVFLISVKLSIL